MHPGGLAFLRRHALILLGSMAAMVLLLLFQQVAQGALQQGDARRKAAALHADTVWRCQQLREPKAREQCLVQPLAAP